MPGHTILLTERSAEPGQSDVVKYPVVFGTRERAEAEVRRLCGRGGHYAGWTPTIAPADGPGLPAALPWE